MWRRRKDYVCHVYPKIGEPVTVRVSDAQSVDALVRIARSVVIVDTGRVSRAEGSTE